MLYAFISEYSETLNCIHLKKKKKLVLKLLTGSVQLYFKKPS